MQRTLASRSLREGQNGIMFAAALKLLIPFVIVVPGIICAHLYANDLNTLSNEMKSGRVLAEGGIYSRVLGAVFPAEEEVQAEDAAPAGEQRATDAAYPLIIKKLIPKGLRGFMLAALAGAVMSSLASMLNSASTIFTMDIFKRYLRKDASDATLVFTGRAMTVIFVIAAA